MSIIQQDTTENKSQTFKFERYFNGHIKAYGIIQDRKRRIITQFEADLFGEWNGNEGALHETFRYYESGKIQKRKWDIQKMNDTRYEGRADDIIGTAIGTTHEGENAIYWQYVMQIEVGNRQYHMRFDDRIWAMSEDVIINRSYFKKFGFTFAEMTVVMQKQAS